MSLLLIGKGGFRFFESDMNRNIVVWYPESTQIETAVRALI